MKASHLKPVDPKEITTLSSSRQPWNTLGGKDGEEPETLSNFVEKDCVPNNLQEFLRVWRKLDREDVEGRYRLLMSLGVEGMKRIFPVEVSSEVVGDIITALHHVSHLLFINTACISLSYPDVFLHSMYIRMYVSVYASIA